MRSSRRVFPVKLVLVQRSCGYALRPTLGITDIQHVVEMVRQHGPADCVVAVDNCYGEMTDDVEPCAVSLPTLHCRNQLQSEHSAASNDDNACHFDHFFPSGGTSASAPKNALRAPLWGLCYGVAWLIHGFATTTTTDQLLQKCNAGSGLLRQAEHQHDMEVTPHVLNAFDV